MTVKSSDILTGSTRPGTFTLYKAFSSRPSSTSRCSVTAIAQSELYTENSPGSLSFTCMFLEPFTSYDVVMWPFLCSYIILSAYKSAVFFNPYVSILHVCPSRTSPACSLSILTIPVRHCLNNFPLHAAYSSNELCSFGPI